MTDEFSLSGEEAQDELLEEAEEFTSKTLRPEEQLTKALEPLQAEVARLVEVWKARRTRE